MGEKLKQTKQITWHILDKMLNLFYQKFNILYHKISRSHGSLGVRVLILPAVHLMQHTKERMTVICCASLHYILRSNITCQSLAHTVQAQRVNWWKALHLHCECYTLHDNIKTMLEQINASKCSVVPRNMYRRTPNIDWRWIHTQIKIPCSVSLVDASIHNNWQKVIRTLSSVPKFLLS